MTQTKNKWKPLLLLHVLLLAYSLASVLSKLAGAKPFLSAGFILLYGGALLLLFGYAVLWQQVLKRLPLSVAYANRGAVLLWGMLWGWLIWGEAITPLKLVALGIVLAGVYLVVSADE